MKNATVHNNKSGGTGAFICEYTRNDGKKVYEVDSLGAGMKTVHWLASNCTIEMVDFYTNEEIGTRDPKRAEGRIGGALRGGMVIGGIFCALGAAGTVFTKSACDVEDLMILGDIDLSCDSHIVDIYNRALNNA